MNRTTKIILTSVCVIAGLTGVFIGIKYYILQKAYNTVLDDEGAKHVLDSATSTVTDGDIIPDDITGNAEANKGTVQQDINGN